MQDLVDQLAIQATFQLNLHRSGNTEKRSMHKCQSLSVWFYEVVRGEPQAVFEQAEMLPIGTHELFHM